MTYKRLFSLMLVLPILISFVLPAWLPVNGVTVLLSLSWGIAGIPYLIFCLIALAVIWRSSDDRIIFLSWISPLVFVPSAVVGWMLYQLAMSDFVNFWGNMAHTIPIIIVGLVVGYAYVFVANALVAACKGMRHLR